MKLPVPRIDMPRTDLIAAAAVGAMTLLLLTMLARVAQLQLSPGPRLVAQMQERTTRRTLSAVRGDIVDRRGRPLAMTRFGYRVFVDPTQFTKTPDEQIAQLAELLGDAAPDAGARIVAALAENQVRDAALKAAPQAPAGAPAPVLASLDSARPADETEEETAAAKPKPLIRYLRVTGIIDDPTVEAVKLAAIPGVHLEQRSVREYPLGELAASIVGKVGVDHNGLLGAEYSHEKELEGQNGRILYVRDARGRPLWMGPDGYSPSKRGQDIRLSIDLELQRIGTEELQRGVEDADAAGGRLIIFDPSTGEVLAMADIIRPIAGAVPYPWENASGAPGARPSPGTRYITIKADPRRMVHPALASNRCVEDVYEPGSTFKPFVWATVTELGACRLDEVIDTEDGHWLAYGRRTISDVIKRDHMTWCEVLVNSSNIGMAKSAARVPHQQLHSAVRRFGFGQRTNIGLPGEATGIVTALKNWSKYTQTSVAFGHEIAVTPLQMVRAFSAFARSGDMAGTVPEARLSALMPDDPSRGVVHRVLQASTALLTRELLRQVAAKMEVRMARVQHESGWRYSIFGKSGTAEIPLGKAPPGKRRPRGSTGYYDNQYNASFIGAGPAELPRLVILCVIDDPGPAKVRSQEYFGSMVAGPVVRRVMERGLSYLGVPPSPPENLVPHATAPSAD